MSRYFFLLITELMLSCSYAQTGYFGTYKLQPVHVEAEDQRHNIIWLPYITVSETNNAGSVWTLQDHKQSVRSALPDSNTVLFACDYDPFGNITETPIRSVLHGRYSYAGTYIWDSSTKIYSSPTRKYIALAKRFISKDPQKSNSSSYVSDNMNPVRYRDPDGASPIDEIIARIRHDEDFLRLGQLQSTSRYEREHNLTVLDRIYSEDPVYTGLTQQVTEMRDIMTTEELNPLQYYSTQDIQLRSEKAQRYKDLVYQYGLANCEECADIMLSTLQKHFPQKNIEKVASNIDEHLLETIENPLTVMQHADHVYNILNRDPSTDINAPHTWNKDVVIVDAWNKKVLTWLGFMKQYYVRKNPDYNIYQFHPAARIEIRQQLPGNAQLSGLTEMPPDEFSFGSGAAWYGE